ncbi:helix-turn-helix transcriptional regulator [Photobacterium leiognathi]|uniref:helix-turn-helix transcriptional regulator n=1 Tax=Photobacterium leiognathi TaxID=553611 RepID=UPI002982AD4F|nr:helix-turn-helix transcriptional regulator [Photobacterium leiognathi]
MESYTSKKREFNYLLKNLRITSGVTQLQASRELGVARQTYLDLESGKTEPRLSMIRDLSQIFSVDVTYFLDIKVPLSSFTTQELLEELLQRQKVETDV